MLSHIRKYKYPITILILLSWLLFFSQYDARTIWQKRQELNEAKEKSEYLKEEIVQMEKEKEALRKDPKAIEKKSRELYFMKKENEDVFVYDTTRASN